MSFIVTWFVVSVLVAVPFGFFAEAGGATR